MLLASRLSPVCNYCECNPFRWLYASGTATDSYINRQNESSAEIRPARLRRAGRISAGVLRTTRCSSQLCLRQTRARWFDLPNDATHLVKTVLQNLILFRDIYLGEFENSLATRFERIFVPSLLDCESAIELFTKTPTRFELSTPNGLIKNMDELIQWDEDRCIYKSDIQFLTGFALKRQGKKSQRSFRTWDEWSAHWNLSPKTSIQSNIRRTRGASHSIFDLENLPEDYQECGADIDKIPNR